MPSINFRLVLPVAVVFLAGWLTGCGSSGPHLPVYEPPLARASLQNVRTTAYTHTESDHLAYGNRNALGGVLRAASLPVVVASVSTEVPPAPLPGGSNEAGGFHRAANPIAGLITLPRPVDPPVFPAAPMVYGSAAADWSRWPAGTLFRLVSTGQVYQVDDYGWALAGRNTIDLYQPTRSAMNAWGVRREDIEILQWGDRRESLRRLSGHQKYRHIKRMVLELEGHHRAAANLR